MLLMHKVLKCLDHDNTEKISHILHMPIQVKCIFNTAYTHTHTHLILQLKSLLIF